MSEPTFTELLNQIRDRYVDFLRIAICAEPVLAVAPQVIPGGGADGFDLPVRPDMLLGSEDAPRVTQVKTDEMVTFEPLTATFPDGFEVALAPFSWEGCDVLADGDPDDWHPVLAWFERWFDRDDEKPEDADGIAPVIHELTEPEVTELGVAFTVDFGAAPIEAFVDLMTTLHEMGLAHVRVGTFYRR